MADHSESAAPSRNIDDDTVQSFGAEWAQFDQSALSDSEASLLFDNYFAIFPWDLIQASAEGFDMGCGSGRWARLVAPRVGKLNCIDPATAALDVARRNLAHCPNVEFLSADVNSVPLEQASQDFGYSLGVLHHIPDTKAALKACTALLKPGAPFLVYLYYRFDNRPTWFRALWKVSESLRFLISRVPSGAKSYLTDLFALIAYLPLARLSLLIEKMGFDPSAIPLSFYRKSSFYTMRTDSRDRFGTPLEQRFTRSEIREMLKESGLVDIRFLEAEPFWVACGTKPL